MNYKLLLLIIIVGVFVFGYVYFDLNQNRIHFHIVKINIKKDSNNYVDVTNEEEFILALENSNYKIINIVNDLDLGFFSLQKKEINSGYIIKHNVPLTHPVLMKTGVSKLVLSNRNGLIIKSSNGSKILHCNIRIENSKNIKIENVSMEELWEWDEVTGLEYDRNDWDYITIKNSKNVIISHCEFSKSYDGITDIKESSNIVIEYCKLNEVDINNNDFYNIQFEELEKNQDKYPIYRFLRKNAKVSIDEIKQIFSCQAKLYLIGPEDYGPKNNNIIIHDCLFLNVRNRVPQARNSSVYVYNVYADSKKINIYKILTDKQISYISSHYHIIVAPSSYGVISIQRSYIVVENCIYDGADNPYTYTRNGKYSNIGRIIIKNNNKLKNLKENLLKKAGLIV